MNCNTHNLVIIHAPRIMGSAKLTHIQKHIIRPSMRELQKYHNSIHSKHLCSVNEMSVSQGYTTQFSHGRGKWLWSWLRHTYIYMDINTKHDCLHKAKHDYLHKVHRLVSAWRFAKNVYLHKADTLPLVWSTLIFVKALTTSKLQDVVQIIAWGDISACPLIRLTLTAF